MSSIKLLNGEFVQDRFYFSNNVNIFRGACISGKGSEKFWITNAIHFIVFMVFIRVEIQKIFNYHVLSKLLIIITNS